MRKPHREEFADLLNNGIFSVAEGIRVNFVEHAPFLAAIVENPDDDLPRLVYADWLEESGDAERAEFIRLHIARWRTKEEQRYPRPMKARIAELRSANESCWRAEMPCLPGVTWGRYWRGFVAEAKFVTPAALVEHAAAAFAATPVRVVQLSGLGPDAANEVCCLPQLGNLHGLRLDEVSLDPALWRTLTGNAWFARLRHLIVHPGHRGRFPSVRAGWGDEVVRLVLTGTSEPSQLRIVHFEMPFVSGDHFKSEYRRRVTITGLSDDLEPL